MNLSKSILLNVLALFMLTTVLGQETDSVPNSKEEHKIVPEKELDTIAMDMEGLEQMEIMESQEEIQDNPSCWSKDKKHTL